MAFMTTGEKGAFSLDFKQLLLRTIITRVLNSAFAGVFSYPLMKNFACKILPIEIQVSYRALICAGFLLPLLGAPQEVAKKRAKGPNALWISATRKRRYVSLRSCVREGGHLQLLRLRKNSGTTLSCDAAEKSFSYLILRSSARCRSYPRW